MITVPSQLLGVGVASLIEIPRDPLDQVVKRSAGQLVAPHRAGQRTLGRIGGARTVDSIQPPLEQFQAPARLLLAAGIVHGVVRLAAEAVDRGQRSPPLRREHAKRREEIAPPGRLARVGRRGRHHAPSSARPAARATSARDSEGRFSNTS